jgi:hypothetical protein
LWVDATLDASRRECGVSMGLMPRFMIKVFN